MRGGAQYKFTCYAICADEVELVQMRGGTFICCATWADDIELVQMRGGTHWKHEVVVFNTWWLLQLHYVGHLGEYHYIHCGEHLVKSLEEKETD